jgi:hypothetical protein
MPLLRFRAGVLIETPREHLLRISGRSGKLTAHLRSFW